MQMAPDIGLVCTECNPAAARGVTCNDVSTCVVMVFDALVCSQRSISGGASWEACTAPAL